ncbi:phosphotransferase enzyme family protein [Nocardia macrotermitis]|uniref:Homoserine kinase n=1 Tax=Nocardia macrotermitis TaxID=2585198 RepID=A0A7K0D206_9NOCA|nr:phosphotransferase [Nocardia macrotermitis]MQY19728.1 Homoserine kinase [Nocardia macrotermitis]
MGTSPTAEPDWPPLTIGEINDVLREHDSRCFPAVDIEWRSPRPLSTTALVRCADGSEQVVKRVPVGLRDAGALAEEHAFMDHLRAQEIPVPEVWSYSGAEFSYEFQLPGAGEDRYRDAFSWSPYLSDAHAAASGAMLARIHCAAEGYDAPARPLRPLCSTLCADPVAAVERHLAARPALAEFLAERDWRADLRAAHAPGAIDLSGLKPLWTHNDWHGTNLLWHGDEITAVLDFGLADRTTAVFDIATAIERFAIDWLAPGRGEPVRVHTAQLAAFLRAYREIRPLTARERAALPEILPLVHIHYELSEIDYFRSVLPRPNRENAEIAYRSYFLGHLQWAASAPGRALRELAGEVSC